MNAYSDIFAETDDYAAKACAIAKRQVWAPIESRKATRETPAQPAVTALVSAPPPVAAPVGETPFQIALKARTDIVNAMTHPMAAKELAQRLDKKEASVARLLRNMELAGLVEVVGQIQRERDSLTINLWAYTGADVAASIRACSAKRTHDARQRVLDILDRPMIARDVAEILGMTLNGARMRLRDMAEAGIIRLHHTPRFCRRGQAADQWVRA